MKKAIVKIIIILVAVGAIVGLTFVLKPKQSIAPAPGLFDLPQELRDQMLVMSDYLRIPGKSGRTALELTLDVAKVEFKKYDFGVFVESINGVKPDEKHFWKLYLNGQESQVGADKLQTKNGDVIEWRIEEIKN